MSKIKEKKLIKIGNSSYALILPKEFVDNGKEVILTYDQHSLNITHKTSHKSIMSEQKLFDQYADEGLQDLAANRKKYFKESLHAKYRRH